MTRVREIIASQSDGIADELRMTRVKPQVTRDLTCAPRFALPPGMDAEMLQDVLDWLLK